MTILYVHITAGLATLSQSTVLDRKKTYAKTRFPASLPQGVRVLWTSTCSLWLPLSQGGCREPVPGVCDAPFPQGWMMSWTSTRGLWYTLTPGMMSWTSRTWGLWCTLTPRWCREPVPEICDIPLPQDDVVNQCLGFVMYPYPRELGCCEPVFVMYLYPRELGCREPVPEVYDVPLPQGVRMSWTSTWGLWCTLTPGS